MNCAKELCRLEINSYAVDRRKVEFQDLDLHQRDADGDAVQYVESRKFPVVLMVWPPYRKPFAFTIADAMKSGQWLIHDDDGQGGCTGDDAFFALVNGDQFVARPDLGEYLNAVHVTFEGLHDCWSEFQTR
jgi:hypothetical protein